MKRRLSIFSFETLVWRPRLGRATVLAIALLAACETMARVAINNGWLRRDFSLYELTAEYLRTLRRDRPNLWLLGNSTLRRGIDAEILTNGTDWNPISLAHGTASLEASVAMLKFYLDRAPQPPKMVIVFVSKDDLNANGYRARVSRRYFEWSENGPPFDLDEWLALSAAKGEIVRSVQRSMAGLALPVRAVSRSKRPVAYDGEPIPRDDPHFTDLALDFTEDLAPLSGLARLCEERGIAHVQVVLMPVTDRYIAFHENLCPVIPYSAIRQHLAVACRAEGFTFHDWGDPSDEYDLFSDSFHLNDTGKRRLSESLRADLFTGWLVNAASGYPTPSTRVSKEAAHSSLASSRR